MKRRKEKEDIMLEKKNAETIEEENFGISISKLEFLGFTLNLTQAIIDITKTKFQRYKLKNNLPLWRKEKLLKKSQWMSPKDL